MFYTTWVACEFGVIGWWDNVAEDWEFCIGKESRKFPEPDTLPDGASFVAKQ